MNTNTEISKFELTEKIDGVPVKFFVYPAGARIGNHMHSFISPAEAFTFFVVAEIDNTGMTDAEFFRSPLAVFEGSCWSGHTNIDTHELLLDSLRKEARREIAQRLTYTAKLELESIAQAGQIEALEARIHEMRQALCFTYGYLEFNLDTSRTSPKQLLNRIYDAIGTLNADYFYDVVEYPLLPAGDAGMFPAAHPRPFLGEEYDSWLDSMADEDTVRFGAGGGNGDMPAPKRNMRHPEAWAGKVIDAEKWNIPAGWHCCPDTGALQSDAQETDEAIAATVDCIRQYQAQQEAAATRIYELKDTLEALLKKRGSNWQDEDGYARLVGESTRVNYRREELDALLLSDPAAYGWLKQYRHESTVAGRVAVK